MLLAPSILAADLSDLAAAVAQCEKGGADLLHVDVMDGHFVPNLTIGIPVVEALAQRTELPLDVHLMVSNPERLIDDYLKAGAHWLSVHWEASNHVDRLLNRIREHGARAGVALNPSTPVDLLTDALANLDFVLLMSVNPGFAGQAFLPYVLEKAKRLKKHLREKHLEVTIAMDGGIGPQNIRQVVGSGVDFCVAGSAIFGTEDPAATIASLRRTAEMEVA